MQIGLALTHLLRGLAKLIHLRRTVRPYWVHVVWTINILIYVLAIWWGMFWWNKLQVWTIEEFLFIIGYSIVVFMLASMLFPWDFPHGLDFEEYFFFAGASDAARRSTCSASGDSGASLEAKLRHDD